VQKGDHLLGDGLTSGKTEFDDAFRTRILGSRPKYVLEIENTASELTEPR
jgi:hypothetical protein